MSWDFRILLSCHLLLLYKEVLSSVTVEEGRAATLQCPGFTPTPGGDQTAVFNWYKAREADVPTGEKFSDHRVAFLAKRDGVVNSEHDLKGRATIDSTTGALQITRTTVSDDHVYTCQFVFTSNGTVKNETHLTITVTPSKQDLQVTANPPGPVSVGESVTFNCSALRVRPPPQAMFWQFTDEPQHFENHGSDTNSDELTSSVSVQYSLTVNRSHHGRKLACHYVSSTRNISSEEMTIQVLTKPLGKPSLQSSKTVVKVNSKVDLKCDSSQVNGSATWFAWQLANGTVLGNTTQPAWAYTAKEKEETIQFVCIAGNWLGQSNKSEPLTIKVQSPGNTNLGLIIGVVVGVVFAIVIIVIGIICWKRRKLLDEKLEPDIQGRVNVNYSQAESTGELIYAQPMKKPRNQKKKPTSNGEYANGNPGDGRTLTEDGLIYMQPDFANGPNDQGGASGPVAPPKPAAKPRHLDHTPTEYGEVDFSKMAELKNK